MLADVLRIETALRRAEFFAGLSEAGRRELARLCRLRAVARGEVIFHEGARGADMFVVAAGRVQLTRAGEDGREVTIGTLAAARTFAEVVLFERDTYPVTATSLTTGLLIVVPGGAVRRRMEDAAFRNEFVGFLMRRMRYLTERIQELTLHDLEARFFAFIRRHYGDGNEVTVDMSKKDLAAAIGATPEALSRLLSRLKTAGTIAWSGRTLRLR